PYRRPSSADTIRLRFPRPTSVTAAGVPIRRLACAPAGHGGTTCLPSAAREDDSERGVTYCRVVNAIRHHRVWRCRQCFLAYWSVVVTYRCRLGVVWGCGFGVACAHGGAP